MTCHASSAPHAAPHPGPDASATPDGIARAIDIAAPRARVWRALTDHEAFGAWFGVRVDGPFVEGEMSTGAFTMEGCEDKRWEAIIETIRPQDLFAWLWRPYPWDPARDYSDEPRTRVEIRLSDIAGGTRVAVTETGFDGIPADRRPEAHMMNSRGWAFQLENVKTYAEA